MKRLNIVFAIILAVTFSFDTIAERLSDIIPNIESSRSIVLNHETVMEYYERLKVTDENAKLTSLQRYDLARHLLDISYLCNALYHQGYYMSYDLPVVKLALNNFPGLNKYRAEFDHIYTGSFEDFFLSNPSLWSSASN